eukprot:scpid65687/ scgid34089/ 
MDEPWDLAKLPASAGKPLAPTAHKKEDRVIITCPKRVDVYAIPESKCVESWSLDRNSRVSSSGEQNTATGNYYVAHEGGIVYQWDETASCHSDWMRHDVHDEVMAIHTFEDIDDALLVTESGAAEWMTTKKEETPRPRKKSKRTPSKSSSVPYRWSGVWLTRYNRKRAVVVHQDSATNDLKVSLFAINRGESPHMMSSRSFILPDDATFMDGCLLRDRNTQLAVLLSNGRVAHFCMESTDSELSLDNDSLVSSFQCNCSAKTCSLVAVDSGHVAIVGLQASDSGEMQPAASIWNIAFSTRLTVRQLKNASNVQKFNAVAVPGSLVVLLDQRVVVVPCRPPKSSVSAIVACRSAAALPAVPTSHVASLGEWSDQAHQDTPPPETATARHPTLQDFLDDKQPWQRDTVEQHVRSGQVSGLIVRTLVERLLAQRDYQLMSACVKFVPDLSEVTLVSVLTSYVQCLIKTKSSKLLYRQVQGFLDSVLTCTYNPAQLRNELRQMPIAIALKLIELLHARIADGYALSDDCKAVIPAVDVCRIMVWMSVVMDAQATKLLLDAEAKKVLMLVNTSLRQQLKVSFQLLRLAGALDGVKRKASVHSAKKSFGQYRIEVLHI